MSTLEDPDSRENEEKLLNPDCPILNLMHVVREACGLKDPPGDLDLATTGGVVANLTMNDQWSNASDLMTDRGAYVVVRVIRNDGFIRYVPLCHPNVQTKDFVQTLRDQERGVCTARTSTASSNTKEARFVDDLHCVKVSKKNKKLHSVHSASVFSSSQNSSARKTTHK